MKSLISMVALTAFCLGIQAAFGAAQDAPRSDGAKLYGDAARGRAIAEQWCVTCHKTGPVIDDQVPSLAALATNPMTDGAIRAFLMKPHKPMPPLEISTQQIEDIVEYLHTLKRTGP